MFLWYVKKENPSEEYPHAQLRPGNSACNSCDVTLNKAKVLTKKGRKAINNGIYFLAKFAWSKARPAIFQGVLFFCIFISVHEVRISGKHGLVYHFD